MKLTINSRDINITKGIESAIESRLSFLEKFLKKDSKVNITISVEKDTQKIEILFRYNNQLVKLEECSSDLYIAIDLIANRLKNNISKLHEMKIEEKKTKEIYSCGYKKNNSIKSKNTINKIVKRKSFNLKPMSEEEAILQLECLGHSSFMFVNADLDFLVCLLYKRKDGNYGIIESTFDDEE